VYQKFLKLKQSKPWVFYLLIIPFAVVFILEMYSKYLVNSGKKIVKDTAIKDEKLKAVQENAEKESKKIEENINKIDKKINETEVKEDWYLDD